MTRAFYPRARIALVAGAAILCFTAAPAFAQMVCGKRADVVKRLEGQYGETLKGAGVGARGTLLEIYTSDNGSFSVVVTLPDGRACLAASGENFEFIKEPKAAGYET